MISTLVTRPEATGFNFPLLLESKTIPNFIVLFTDEDTGTVVSLPHGHDDSLSLGLHSNTWDIDTFDFFDGAVESRNESELIYPEDAAEDLAQDEDGTPACDGDCANCSTKSPEIAPILATLVAMGLVVDHGPSHNLPVQPTADTPPTAVDSDCGHDNAFAAMLARIVADSSQKS